MPNDWPTPTTAPEVGQHLLECTNRFFEQYPGGNLKNWENLKERMLRWVKRLDPDTAFFGLLWILENHTRYQYQLLAGELLDRASLESPLPLPVLLDRIVPQFEESANTIPRFLSNAFGQDTVMQCLREMRGCCSSAGKAAKIRTMLYWLGERVPE